MNVEWMNGAMLAWAGALGVVGAGSGYLLARLSARRVQRRVEHLRGELREMETDHFFEKQALAAKIRGLEKVADGLKARAEKLHGEKVSYQMRYESLRKSYASLEKENARLAEKLRAELAELTARRVAVERRLEKERAQWQEEKKRLEAELQALREENERLQAGGAVRSAEADQPPVLAVVPVEAEEMAEAAEVDPALRLPDFKDSEFERWMQNLRREMDRVAAHLEQVERQRDAFQRDAETLMLDVHGLKARLGL